MKYLLIIFFSMMTISLAEISLRQYNDLYCYDGDTCYVTVDGTKTKVRLLELDTPEISKPKCNAELQLGLKARDYLNVLTRVAGLSGYLHRYRQWMVISLVLARCLVPLQRMLWDLILLH